MPQHLTVETVIKACHDALTNKTLLAFHPEAAKDKFDEIICRYSVGKFRCAIGVALNDETLSLIDKHKMQSAGLIKLIRMNIVTVDDKEKRLLIEIQMMHDDWTRNINPNGHKEFKRLLFSIGQNKREEI